MKLDENFRIETFNQLLLRYNNALGKHPVLESKRPSKQGPFTLHLGKV